MGRQYILDGCHVVYDQTQAYTIEPSTGRKLNIIDMPSNNSEAVASTYTIREPNSNTDHEAFAAIYRGRGLLPERVIAPKPQRPCLARQVIDGHIGKATADGLQRPCTQPDPRHATAGRKAF